MPPTRRKTQATASSGISDAELTDLDEELAALEAATDLSDLDMGAPEEPLDEQLDIEDDAEDHKNAPTAPVAEDEADVEDFDEEDDEFDEELEDTEDEELVTEDIFDVMDRNDLKRYNYVNELGVTVKRSMTDGELRDAVRRAGGTHEKESVADHEPPKKKGPGRPRGSRNKQPRVRKPVQATTFSAEDVAAIGDIPEHQVRAFARKHPNAFPKASPKSQYRFNARQVRVLLRGTGAKL